MRTARKGPCHTWCAASRDGGGRPSDPLETGTVFLKIRDGMVLLESIAHGSPQYNRRMGFLKNVVTLLHLWSIDPRISLSIIGETGLLEDCSCPRQRRLTGSSPDGFVAETPPASACNLSSNLDGRLNTLIYWPKGGDWSGSRFKPPAGPGLASVAERL